MPPEPDAAALIQRLAVELAECRLRGIERLDLRTHNQNRVAASDLQRLAAAYTAAEGLALHGRTAQIKQLLWDAIAAMADDREPAATLVRDLLFGDPPPIVEVAVIGGPVRIGMVTKSAGDLLDQAFQRSGMTRARFDEQRKAAFLSFGEFLVAFCAQFLPAEPDDPVDPADAEGILVTRRAEDPGGPGPHSLRTGHVHDGRFVELLSEAVNATIVGFTNEHLTGYLARALDRKIALQGPGAFWGSLRVVFCSNRLLEAIIDERLDLPDRGEAVRQRRFAAFYGRRSLTVFLRRKIRAARWPIYESPFLPQFAGTLFELPSGQRVVHLLIRSPQRTSSEHMYLELAETPDQYLTRVFEDIVANSATDNTIIPVGIPRGGGFERTGTRYRHNVLIDHSGATGWLPYVLVVTWRRRGDHAEPLLQLRTLANSERELDRLTHPVTHVYQEDYDESPSGAVPVPPPRIDLTDLPPQRAARRRLGLEAGEDFPTELVPEGITQYLHHDREHLFFFVYSREVPQDFQFPRQADMHPVPFAELLAIMENQALRKAELLLRASPMSNRARVAAAEIVALNLTLHGHAEIAEQLAALAAQRQPASDRFAATIGQLIVQTSQPWVSGGREIHVLGLSGLHYREFFSTLLPLYARLGVPGAADYLASLKADDARSAAIARLAELYNDVDVITDIPAEL